MQLSKPEVVEMLNRHFVTVNVDVHNLASAADEKTYYQLQKDSNAWMARLPAETRTVLHPKTSIRFLSPQGQILNMIVVDQPLMPALTEIVQRLQVPEAAATASAARKPPPGRVPLHVTARFLQAGDEDACRDIVLPKTPPHQPLARSLPEPDQLYRIRLAAPTDEGFDIRPDGLICPTPAVVGKTYELAAEFAADLFYRFSPPTHDCHPSAGEVESCHVTGTVESVQADVVTIHLSGTLRKRHPWFPEGGLEEVSLEGQELVKGRDYHWSECAIEGFMEYDAAQRIRFLDAVSVGGRYLGNDGTLMPFAAAMRLETAPSE